MATNITSVPSDPETYAIIGAAMAVHSELGCGFLEAVYKAALCVEFHHRGIAFQPEVALPILYKGERLPLHYRVDFRCGDVLVAVKALDAIGPNELAQALNYLRAWQARRPRARTASPKICGICEICGCLLLCHHHPSA